MSLTVVRIPINRLSIGYVSLKGLELDILALHALLEQILLSMAHAHSRVTPKNAQCIPGTDCEPQAANGGT